VVGQVDGLDAGDDIAASAGAAVAAGLLPVDEVAPGWRACSRKRG
jgi:hypothetical protein